MNKYISAIVLTALGFNATPSYAATVSYTQVVSYGSSWTLPPVPPLTTSINIEAIGQSVWYLDCGNNTDTPREWNLSVQHTHSITTAASVLTSGGTSNFAGIMPAFTSQLVEDNMIVSQGFTYTSQADINAIRNNPVITSDYGLGTSSTGLSSLSAFPSPDNVTQITVTYTYGVVDDCDDDDHHEHDKKHKKNSRH